MVQNKELVNPKLTRILRKLLFLLFIIPAIVNEINGQCSPDVSITTPGIYPEYINNAVIGVFFSDTLQIKVPLDTSLNSIPATVESIEIVNVEGLPTGFSYDCDNPFCSWGGDQNGCAVIQCTNPLAQDSGIHPLIVYMDYYAKVGTFTIGPIPDTIYDYSIVIEKPAGIQIKGRDLIYVRNIPNPFALKTEIIYNSMDGSEVEIEIWSVDGRIIRKEIITSKPGENDYVFFPGTSMKPGIYHCLLKSESFVAGCKMTFLRPN